MNYSLKLSNIQVSAPDAMVDVKIGEVTISVENLDMMQSLKIAKELPGIILDLRYVMETPLEKLHPECGCESNDARIPGLGFIIAKAMHDRMADHLKKSTGDNDEISNDDEIEGVADENKA